MEASANSNQERKVLVTGAGGFIGGHLARYLRQKGYWVRGADIKNPEFLPKKTLAHEFCLVDLRKWENCKAVTEGIDEVYNLAANMGGIGFISESKAEVMRDNILINTHMLEASRVNTVKRLFFSSSACVYPTYKQEHPNVTGLKEVEAYPADPDNEYGWEKLFTERLCMNYYAEFGLETRIARYHNIYGPYGTWTGGREKSPAAICRKIAAVGDGGTIEIWGDGKQTRSYCFIDDCLEGTYRLMQSTFRQPLNIGSNRLVTIDQLSDIVGTLARKSISRHYERDKPQGVRGRNSDNELIRKVLQWEPQITLEEGLKQTYAWIEGQVQKQKQKPTEVTEGTSWAAGEYSY